jgi:hypothetical protein
MRAKNASLDTGQVGAKHGHHVEGNHLRPQTRARAIASAASISTFIRVRESTSTPRRGRDGRAKFV